MENQNDEADLVNDLSEVLNELKEIEERSVECDLWRTAAWNGNDSDFVCFERCDGVTIQEAVKYSVELLLGSPTKSNAWLKLSQRGLWHDPQNMECTEGWMKNHIFGKREPSCDPSVNGCMWD